MAGWLLYPPSKVFIQIVIATFRNAYWRLCGVFSECVIEAQLTVGKKLYVGGWF